MPEPNITRSEVIVVAAAEQNQYGDLIIKDKGGKDYKLGKKRSHLFKIFVPERAVNLKFSVYMDREYIADAVSVEKELENRPPVVKSTLVDEAMKMGAVKVGIGKDESIARAVALKAAVDLASNGKIELDEITSAAEVYLGWLMGK